MRYFIGFVFVFLASSVIAQQNETGGLTQIVAKKKAQDILAVMEKVENIATLDRVLQDAISYKRNFDAPLNKELAGWPSPYWAPENKAIEPYNICSEAALSLMMLAEARKRTGDSMAPDVVKARNAYRDQKARCAGAIKKVN